jgi:hypothetical protein
VKNWLKTNFCLNLWRIFLTGSLKIEEPRHMTLYQMSHFTSECVHISVYVVKQYTCNKLAVFNLDLFREHDLFRNLNLGCSQISASCKHAFLNPMNRKEKTEGSRLNISKVFIFLRMLVINRWYKLRNVGVVLEIFGLFILKGRLISARVITLLLPWKPINWTWYLTQIGDVYRLLI